MWKITLAIFGLTLGATLDALVRWGRDDAGRISKVERELGELRAHKPAEKTIGTDQAAPKETRS